MTDPRDIHNAVQTASHWGVYSVRTDRDGAIVDTAPFARDRNPTPLMNGLPGIVRDSLRIDQPYIREGFLRRRASAKGERGAESFVAVGWDAALEIVESELRRVKAEHGNEAIYGGSYGWASAGRLHHAPSVLKRFLGLHGGYVDKLGNHSYGAALHIMPYVLGRGDIAHLTVPWPSIVENTRLVVMFGGANLKNTQIDSGGMAVHENPDWFRKARANGVEFVSISPLRQDTAAFMDATWLPLRPNTDVAVMLGLAHTLVSEGLHDRDFLARYCVGFEPFENYLLGRSDNQPKSADWAGAISDVPPETIRSLARRMARERTLITTSWSVQRADHGEQPIWMTVVLAALLGQIGLPGGGFSFGIAAMSSISSPHPGDIPRPTLPLGRNAVTNHIPVGRVTEMLLNPGTQLDYNGRVITLPDIKLIYSTGGNPFHHNTNLNRFVKAWQRPDTVIVHEPWWTPVAKFADIVLPATTTMERNDIQASELSRYYVAMHKIIDPVGQSRNDFDIFAELAQRLGFGDAFTEGRSEMDWLAHIYEHARRGAIARGYAPPPFDAFWEDGFYEFPLRKEPELLLSAFRQDPDKNPLKTPSGRIEIASEKIASFAYPDCPLHPQWLEPAEWLGSPQAALYPLHLISNQPHARLHSQMDASALSRATKIAGREPLLLHPDDAHARGLKPGDIARVFNDRGAFLAGVCIADDIRPGVVQIATGAWYDPQEPGRSGSLDKHGNPNVVTGDKGTSRLAQSSVAQTVLVEVERHDDAPAVTAFDWPRIMA